MAVMINGIGSSSYAPLVFRTEDQRVRAYADTQIPGNAQPDITPALPGTRNGDTPEDGVRVTLSGAAPPADAANEATSSQGDGRGNTAAEGSTAGKPAATGGDQAAKEDASTGASRSSNGEPLSEEEQAQVAKLAQRDQEVRAHEMAHVAAGAGLVTRGASYGYETGPDGKRYAVSGEVGISTSPGRTPEETLAKAEQIRAAALAPAEPSSQDMRVAAQATRMASEARMEIAAAQREGALGEPSRPTGGRGDGAETSSVSGGRLAAYQREASSTASQGTRVNTYA